MFKNNDAIDLSTVEIIQKYGYPFEVHPVTTEDGYILELHRIPRSKSGQHPTRNHPVFIHHGVLECSASWVLGGPKYSLAMQLADDGYDVWLANSRGNTYSRKHTTMTYNQEKFWEFTLNEIGIYDLPASIDYILEKTDVSQLHYIGFSTGNTVFYIMASEKPDYHLRIRSQISLAPLAYMYNTRSIVRYSAKLAKAMSLTLDIFNSTGMFMAESWVQKFFAKTAANEIITKKLFIQNIIFLICGSDSKHFNSDLIPLILGHFPAGTSTKLMVHLSQLINKDRFGKFDYGLEENKKRYNAAQPPAYNLKSIKVPITLMYGQNDSLADTKDVMKLRSQLPKLLDAFSVDNVYCNHVDFLWSKDVKQDVNDPIKRILEKTDNIIWKFKGGMPAIAQGVFASPPPFTPPTKTLPEFVPGLKYFEEHLESIIANIMPQHVNEKDKMVFEQEQERQKILFQNLIEYAKASETNVDELLESIPGVVSNWLNHKLKSPGK